MQKDSNCFISVITLCIMLIFFELAKTGLETRITYGYGGHAC